MLKTIGVLSSGGDAPGMNPAIRAVVRKGIYHGLTVYGIEHGYVGLMEGQVIKMTPASVGGIIQRGGTILHTARSKFFMTHEGKLKAMETIKKFGIDALVIIGGDGSYHGAMDLSEYGVNVVGVPGTIDNDIAGTEYTIGYDTALNTIIDAVDKIRDTATSHERTFIVEVMGREAGFLALMSGISCGAEAILIPEIPFDLEELSERLLKGIRRGKNHNIIILAEGVGKASRIAPLITEKTGLEIRISVLGHIQRGGTPTYLDRIMASRFGAAAVDTLMKGERNKAIGWKDGKLRVYDLKEAVSFKRKVDPELYELSKILSI